MLFHALDDSSFGPHTLVVKKMNTYMRMYGGPGGRATKHCTTRSFAIEQYSNGPMPRPNNDSIPLPYHSPFLQ